MAQTICLNPFLDSGKQLRPDWVEYLANLPESNNAPHQPEAANLFREKLMKNNPVGWFEIYVQDMDRARRFYESVFQGKLEKLESPDSSNIEMLVFPMGKDSFGASGTLVKMPGYPSGGNSVLVYFTCADCVVEGSRVKASGGRVQREKMAIGQYGFIVLAIDTEGNMIGLHSMK